VCVRVRVCERGDKRTVVAEGLAAFSAAGTAFPDFSLFPSGSVMYSPADRRLWLRQTRMEGGGERAITERLVSERA